ncbi:MAG: metal-dependent hydrolase [Candidatus Eisenbacteria bacterium]|nr:metal-dependent hydrolase [Candidatus Eisenbacteria bacterium]
MNIRWLGHSCFQLTGTKTVLIDPFLTGNPKAAIRAEEVKDLDFLVVTHGHADHLGDAYPIAERTGATLVSIFEITSAAEERKINVEPMNIGGTVENGGVRFHMVSAAHSSPGSTPTGFVIEMDGWTVYHMGDTGLIPDMEMLPRYFSIDVALVPIGDRFTMGAASAAEAVKMCGAKRAVPMHFGTFPLIAPNADRFVERMRGVAEVKVLRPGESFDL